MIEVTKRNVSSVTNCARLRITLAVEMINIFLIDVHSYRDMCYCVR